MMWFSGIMRFKLCYEKSFRKPSKKCKVIYFLNIYVF